MVATARPPPPPPPARTLAWLQPPGQPHRAAAAVTIPTVTISTVTISTVTISTVCARRVGCRYEGLREEAFRATLLPGTPRDGNSSLLDRAFASIASAVRLPPSAEVASGDEGEWAGRFVGWEGQLSALNATPFTPLRPPRTVSTACEPAQLTATPNAASSSQAMPPRFSVRACVRACVRAGAILRARAALLGEGGGA
eukprot:SAG25_NODE_4779_length_750_cov_2.867896_1_plen_198_part_00